MIQRQCHFYLRSIVSSQIESRLGEDSHRASPYQLTNLIVHYFDSFLLGCPQDEKLIFNETNVLFEVLENTFLSHKGCHFTLCFCQLFQFNNFELVRNSKTCHNKLTTFSFSIRVYVLYIKCTKRLKHTFLHNKTLHANITGKGKTISNYLFCFPRIQVTSIDIGIDVSGVTIYQLIYLTKKSIHLCVVFATKFVCFSSRYRSTSYAILPKT